jgi:hypothetical protein
MNVDRIYETGKGLYFVLAEHEDAPCGPFKNAEEAASMMERMREFLRRRGEADESQAS